MYEYSIIEKFYENWAEYKKVELSKSDLITLSFYGNEHYKLDNDSPLFEDYVETDVDFNWDIIDEDTAGLLVKVWNTYIHIIENGGMYAYVANENNYRDIAEKVYKDKDSA